MKTVYRIDADVLIPGLGEPVVDGSVIISGRTIDYAGPAQHALTPASAVTVRVPAVMPGMWDAHCHLFGTRSADLHELATAPAALRAARSVGDVGRALGAGFTSLRELGGLGVHLAAAITEGSVAGPAIYGAGAILSMTGGHGDIHSLPVQWVASSQVDTFEICDGVSECVRAVRRQLRLGARVIKVCASGGALSEIDDPHHQQFSDEELKAIVDEAARADRVVAAHCHGKAGVLAAVRAGVRTIEHGTYLDVESARAMADSGAILVPTRTMDEQLLSPQSPLPVPIHVQHKLADIYQRSADAVAIAYQSGVTIAAGSDILASGAVWGSNGRELELLSDCGITPADCITASTAHGPLTLGSQAPLSGELKASFDADVIAISGNPLERISLLGDPANVTHVWQSGRLVKGAANVTGGAHGG